MSNNIGSQIHKLRESGAKFKEITKTVNTLNGTSYKQPSIRRMYYEWKANEAMKVKTLKRHIYQDLVQVNIKNPRVLIIPDVHLPFIAAGFLEFLNNTKSEYNLDTVVCIGDILDFYAVSAWDKDPDAMGPDNELYACIPQLIAMADMFPEMYVSIGNHDARPQRQGRKSGMPSLLIRHFNEVIDQITEGQADTSEWHWNNSYILNETTLIEHGSTSGLKATYDRAMFTGMNVIQGHTHSYAGVTYINDGINRMRWAMNVGCGINAKEYAFRYGKNNKFKPTLGCGVLIDGVPRFEPFYG